LFASASDVALFILGKMKRCGAQDGKEEVSRVKCVLFVFFGVYYYARYFLALLVVALNSPAAHNYEV